jgi:hypothetical protein
VLGGDRMRLRRRMRPVSRLDYVLSRMKNWLRLLVERYLLTTGCGRAAPSVPLRGRLRDNGRFCDLQGRCHGMWRVRDRL